MTFIDNINLKKVTFFLFILLFFPFLLISQSKVDILKKDLNEKNIINKLNRCKNRCLLNIRVLGVHVGFCNIDYLCIPSYKFNCLIDSTIFKKNIIDILELENNRSLDGEHFLLKDGNYIGSIYIYNEHLFSPGRISFNKYSEKTYNILKSEKPDFVFKIFGIMDGILFIKDDIIKIIDNEYNITDFETFFYTNPKLASLKKAYSNIDKKYRFLP